MIFRFGLARVESRASVSAYSGLRPKLRNQYY